MSPPFAATPHAFRYTTGWAKNGATDSLPQFCQILTDLITFFTGRFLGKLAVKWTLKIPPYLAYVATLPCETLVSAKRAINDKLQGSVATYLRHGGVVNNQIKKGLQCVAESVSEIF